MTKEITRKANLNNETEFRCLSPEEISFLEKAGNSAENWNEVLISPELDLANIKKVRFRGKVKIKKGAVLEDIRGGISNCTIGKNVCIQNVGRIEYEPEASCGIGVIVNTLDETGSRPVRIYPGMTSQIATLMAREPKWYENNLKPYFEDFLDTFRQNCEIGDESVIRDCGRINNVNIGNNIIIEGVPSLANGTIINNAPSSKSSVKVGAGVDAENFIIEDANVDSGAILRNCYIGQGTHIGKGFTAHDSLFFANCSFENGEACALLAGPYTVSMHKGSLLIGCQTSFMNAGSSTNESNHMYKLGPVHWGILERGVKTASGSYIMFGARIGAFSLVMGAHKTHPDSSSFPFSYLFGDERGATVVVPGAMLRSCGLLRDEKKWPTRDKRIKDRLPLNDNITFNVLNPFTVEGMLGALDAINELLVYPADDDHYVRYKGMKFTRASLERGKLFYSSAIFKYLSLIFPDRIIPESDGKAPDQWLDLGGQIIMRQTLNRVLETTTPDEATRILKDAFDNYEKDEKLWISRRLDNKWKVSPEEILRGASKFDELIEEDRKEYLENLAREEKMLAL